MTTDHPLLDGVTGDCAWTESLAGTVYFGEGLRSFLAWSARRGLRPVLVTRPDAEVTYPVLNRLWASGALWLRRAGDGFLDLRSGAVYESVGAVPQRAEEASGLEAPPMENSHIWSLFSVGVRHPATEVTRLGAVVEVVWEALTGTLPAAWGWHEPCLVGWDRDGYTDSARLLMPKAELVVSGAERWPIQAIGTVLRTAQGLEETIAGVAVAGPDGLDMAGLEARAVRCLADVAAQIPVPVFGVVAAGRGGSAVRLRYPSLGPVAPLAVLAGPDLAEMAGQDVRGFAAGHGGIVAGRGWAPSMVIGLSEAGVGVWDRLRMLASEFLGPQFGPVGEPGGVEGMVADAV